MLESVLGLAAEPVELILAAFEHGLLVLEILAELFVFVALAGVIALLLVELALTLLDFRFLALHPLQPLIRLLFSLGFDPEFFLAGFHEFVFGYHVSLPLCIFYYCLCLRAGGNLLGPENYGDTDRSPDQCGTYIKKYLYHILFFVYSL